jgi:hypothetical protein
MRCRLHEERVELGMEIKEHRAYTTKSDVILQWPDKLRVITRDGPASEFYYDGKIVATLSIPRELRLGACGRKL